jgi:hypothetical protein
MTEPSTDDPPRPPPGALASFARSLASVDPRTLGLFRIALALLLIVDLVKRAFSVRHWYFDGGLLPFRHMLPEAQRVGLYSIFWYLQGDLAVCAAFAAILAVYLGLLVGYRTRLMQLLALGSVVSLHARVSWVCNGGDFVLCSLLWWTLFLPLGKRFSLDARREPEEDTDEPVDDGGSPGSPKRAGEPALDPGSAPNPPPPAARCA